MTTSYHPGDPADHGLFDDYDSTEPSVDEQPDQPDRAPSEQPPSYDAEEPSSESSDPNEMPQRAPPSVEQQPSSQYEDLNDTRRTKNMTTLFLTLMVLYIGFCLYYRRTKTRRSVGDSSHEVNNGNGENSDTRRQQQRRDNQVVLDESISASTRAMTNAEEKAKLEERKMNIKKALLLRLIVEEEEEEEQEGNECEKHCECEQCQYWRWEDTTAAATAAGVETKGGEEVSLASDVHAAPASSKRAIITIQEDDEEDSIICELASDDEAAQQAIAAESRNDCEDIEAQSLDNKKDGTTPTTTTSSAPSSPTLAPLSPPTSPQMIATMMPTPPSSPSRLSLSSPTRKYTDALNCGNRRCGNNVVRHAILNCSNHNGKHMGSTSVHGNNNDCSTTISLASIIGMYGEECNICLSQFQVGDRAAWSKEHCADSGCEPQVMPMIQGSNCVTDVVGNGNEAKRNLEEEEGMGYGCTHVFHEECISRWLLVRDGCPICRRTYFPNGVNDATDDDINAASSAGASGRSNEVDLERGETNLESGGNDNSLSTSAV